MKTTVVIYICIIISIFFATGLTAQTNLYVSKQTGQRTSYSGSYSKTTDRYSHGTTTFSQNDKLDVSVTPSDLSIGTNSTKNWSGTIAPNVANAPTAGSSESTTLTANYNVFYSRPAGMSSAGSVVSTYTCGGTCSAHSGSPPGNHEIVNETGTRSISFNIISIKVKISGKPSACKGDTLQYTATAYPGNGTGVLSWSNGSVSNTIQVVAKNSDVKVSVTYTVSGVSYSDSFTTTVSVPGPWTRGLGSPTFTAWQNQLNKVDKIKKGAKDAIQAIPAKITVKGPEFSFAYEEKDCCKDGNITVKGEKKVSGTISGGIYANDVPLAPPPWTGSFGKTIQRYGYVFKLEIAYGLLLDVGGEFKGTIGYRINECVPEDCFTGDIGLNFPITLAIKASGTACIVAAYRPSQRCKGTKVDGTRCNRMTTNKCGYCSNSNGPNVPPHTSQSWWCFGCPSFNVTPASISSNVYGNVTYNKNSCTDGFGASCGIGPVVFTASVGVLGYNLSWSYEIWGGAQLYP